MRARDRILAAMAERWYRAWSEAWANVGRVAHISPARGWVAFFDDVHWAFKLGDLDGARAMLDSVRHSFEVPRAVQLQAERFARRFVGIKKGAA